MTSRRARRRVAVVAACVAWLTAACSDALLGPPVAANHAAVFDELWHQVDLHYSFFDLKAINWDSLGAYYRSRAIDARNDVQFALVLSRMLSELEDVHVSITPANLLPTLRYESAAETVATRFSSLLVLNRYVSNARSSATGHVIYGTLNSSVGYLRIDNFEGSGWATDVDAALEELRGATQLVVDVRDNPGGTIALAAEIAGRFTDRSRTYGYVRYRDGPHHGDFTSAVDEVVGPAGPRQFTGRVFVLTNRRVVSSAEDFVLAMTAIPTTITVGDTTAGASGGPIVRDLPNGWTFQISEWIESTLARHAFEGIGLPPGVVVKATASDARNNIDAALEMALTLTQSP